MKNSIFARFARVFFIFWHFEDVLVLSTTWNDLFCRCVDDVSIWWQMFNFVFLCPKCWFQFNSRMVRIHFSSIMTLNNWKMIAETQVTFSDDVLAFVDVVLSSLVSVLRHAKNSLFLHTRYGNHSSFRSCNLRSTTASRRSLRQRFLK